MIERARPGPCIRLVGMALVLGLAGCAETEFAAQTAKRMTRSDAPGSFKVGRPYTIDGAWYYPKVDYEYAEEGLASWYGPKFHGRRTANGEQFNMHEMTAAHKTLPMPSMVRVTNLENGRSLELRVNDRGPFVDDRIIDVSQRAAELLGFRQQGVARVRVEILADESRALADPAAAAALAAALPAPEPVPVVSHALAFDAAAPAAGYERAVPATYVQAGAFASYPNAENARRRLEEVGTVEISTVSYGERPLFRVRIGPLPSESHAEDVLAAVVRAGYPGSRIVSD